MKLYSMAGSCSLTDHIALEWIGKPYEFRLMAREDLKTPEFLALNPLGSVPCLTDGDFALTQNVAILEYLDDVYPEANLLGSQDIRDKAEARRWLSFCNADLHKMFGPLFVPGRFIADEAVHPALRAQAAENVKQLLSVADHALNGKEYLSGKKSVADAYLFVILRWYLGMEFDLNIFKNLPAFVERMQADKGVQAAMRKEGLL
ncbi:MAG: glutathione S-transferase N-terminal domain-containing protein [Neisseria sp.]|nr:glutathione S-transferase N-terminal domain-containing protein [Neisseria sp.]